MTTQNTIPSLNKRIKRHLVQVACTTDDATLLERLRVDAGDRSWSGVFLRLLRRAGKSKKAQP